MKLISYLLIIAIVLLSSCESKSANDYLQDSKSVSQKGNYKEAIRFLDKAINKNPKLKEAYIQRGLSHEYLKMDDSAINDYNKLLLFDSQNTTALYYIGLCKYRQNLYGEAIEYYNKTLITKGFNPEDTSPKGQFVLNFNKNGILGEEAKFDIASYEIFYERGLAYYQNGQIQQSYFDFENCISQGYNVGESHYMIGLCWLTANKKEKACEAFRKSSFYGSSLAKKQFSEVCK